MQYDCHINATINTTFSYNFKMIENSFRKKCVIDHKSNLCVEIHLNEQKG